MYFSDMIQFWVKFMSLKKKQSCYILHSKIYLTKNYHGCFKFRPKLQHYNIYKTQIFLLGMLIMSCFVITTNKTRHKIQHLV